MPRAGLDAKVVSEAAASIVDQEGRGALTLARVAAALGVAAPSLYKHVAGLDDLIFRVATLAVRRLADELVRAVMGRSGRQALLSMARAYRSFALEHPGLYALTLAEHPLESAERQAEVERAVQVMAAVASGFGVPDHLLVDAIRIMRAGLHGFADLEMRGSFRLPEGVDGSFHLLVDLLSSGLETLARAQATPETP